MNDILVSVVVATYHRDDKLYNALSSLAEQTHKKIEIIVVDDNADSQWNERVSAVVDKFRENSHTPICKIVNEVNKGSAAARNIGIAAAEGEYITFLDDDDVYLPEKIERQLSDFLASEADYGLTDLYIYDDNEKVIDSRIRSYIKTTGSDDLLRCHLLYHMTGTDTLMFKAEYLRKIGGFPGIDVGDEFYLMKEAILGGGRFVYSPHCYVKAYIHTGESEGLSSGQGKIDGENALYAEKKKYLSYLTPKDVRYVKTRHYAVIAFAQLRRHSYCAFLGNAFRAFISSPACCLNILSQHNSARQTDGGMQSVPVKNKDLAKQNK